MKSEFDKWKEQFNKDDPMIHFYEGEMEMLRRFDNVEAVESLRCKDCSETGHWGWCDAPWIICMYKFRIKEILGETDSKYHSIKEQMPEVFK